MKTDELKWIKRFLDLSVMVSTWSKDPRTKIGSIIVAPNGQVISQGFNGFPRGIEDTDERLNDRPTKHKLVVHAEVNSILSACYNGFSLKDCSLFINSLCCAECAKVIIQSGIKKVYMIERDSNFWNESHDLSLNMFKECGVEYHVFDKDMNELKKD